MIFPPRSDYQKEEELEEDREKRIKTKVNARWITTMEFTIRTLVEVNLEDGPRMGRRQRV